jgi:restriction system protein
VLAGAGPLSGEEVYNRIVAGRLYAFKALNPKAVVRGQLRRHCLGLDFPTASPVKYFRLVGEDRYELGSAKGVRTAALAVATPASGTLPEEAMEKAYQDHVLALGEELKEKILSNHPAFFERWVIDLLLAMGYGGSDPSLGIHTGGPGDGGIDGIINEDRLGLEQIYLQAKRYALDREVKRAEVQAFAGAMNKIRKGVLRW